MSWWMGASKEGFPEQQLCCSFVPAQRFQSQGRSYLGKSVRQATGFDRKLKACGSDQVMERPIVVLRRRGGAHRRTGVKCLPHARN